MREPKLRFDHVAIPVSDAGKARRFYSEVLGLPLVDAMSGDDWGGKPWLMMMFRVADDRQIALCALRGAKRVAPDQGIPADIRHFAFSAASESEYSAWKERLESHAVAFSEEDHGAQRSIYFSDPDGTMLEITTPPSSSADKTNRRACEVIERWLHGQA